jgi:4-diphosphocytidyl-2-C-methyl-D-erythritol kinase
MSILEHSLSTSPIAIMLTVRAYAKINIGLFVLRRRPDGYHDIETVFHRVDIYDELTFTPASEIIIESSDPAAPADERNICYKAAHRLALHLGIAKGVRITLQKNIPVGAGLGGGSSDAASVLLHLPQFWGETIDPEMRHRIGTEIGSDVPFFLMPGSAVGKGRGEILEHFPLDIPFTILLCNPGVHISTPWAYQHVRPSLRQSSIRQLVMDGITRRAFEVALVNDFEDPVFTAYPAIAEVKMVMQDCGSLLTLMSGSGSTVFGFFQNDRTATDATRSLTERGWKTFLTAPGFVPADRP